MAGDHKCASQILSSLMPGAPDLGFSVAMAHEQIRQKLESLGPAELLQGNACDPFRLIKPTLCLLVPVQWNRDNRDPAGWNSALQASYDFCQHWG